MSNRMFTVLLRALTSRVKPVVRRNSEHLETIMSASGPIHIVRSPIIIIMSQHVFSHERYMP